MRRRTPVLLVEEVEVAGGVSLDRVKLARAGDRPKASEGEFAAPCWSSERREQGKGWQALQDMARICFGRFMNSAAAGKALAIACSHYSRFEHCSDVLTERNIDESNAWFPKREFSALRVR